MATVTAVVLTETVSLLEDVAPEEVDVVLAVVDDSVFELDAKLGEMVEDVSLGDEELAEDEEPAEDDEPAEDELTVLEVADAVAA